jgi:hypothetical protein
MIRATDSAADGLFKFTFTNELIFYHDPEANLKLFLIIVDSKGQFLSIHDRQDGRLNMYVKLISISS